MAKVISQQSTENREYVRKLLKEKQPEFSAALELAADLVGRELVSPDAARLQRFRGLATSNVTPPGAPDVAQAFTGHLNFIPPAGVHDARAGSYPCGGFASDFATADGERVRVEAFTRRQFTDLARATGLARTFAFAERVLDADFCARSDLFTHRVTIAALLASWFARRTVADLVAAFAGSSVSWAHLHDLAGQPKPRHAAHAEDGR